MPARLLRLQLRKAKSKADLFHVLKGNRRYAHCMQQTHASESVQELVRPFDLQIRRVLGRKCFQEVGVREGKIKGKNKHQKSQI